MASQRSDHVPAGPAGTGNLVVLRSALLGAVTGGRSMTGLAAVALTTPAGVRSPWVRWLGSPWGRGVTTTAAAGEIVADKSPRIPSRLSPPALVGRIALGALTAGALARRDERRPLVPVLLATVTVVAGSVAGSRWRAYAGRRGFPALAAAMAEDLTVVGLAAVACAGKPRRPRDHAVVVPNL